MCLAIPGKIIKIEGDDATVSYGDETRTAKLMDPDIKVGDYVVVQNKLILQKVEKVDAMDAINEWSRVLNED